MRSQSQWSFRRNSPIESIELVDNNRHLDVDYGYMGRMDHIDRHESKARPHTDWMVSVVVYRLVGHVLVVVVVVVAVVWPLVVVDSLVDTKPS